MANVFTITTAQQTLKADADGRATTVFTVTNATSRPLRGIAKIKPRVIFRRAARINLPLPSINPNRRPRRPRRSPRNRFRFGWMRFRQIIRTKILRKVRL